MSFRYEPNQSNGVFVKDMCQILPEKIFWTFKVAHLTRSQAAKIAYLRAVRGEIQAIYNTQYIHK